MHFTEKREKGVKKSSDKKVKQAKIWKSCYFDIYFGIPSRRSPKIDISYQSVVCKYITLKHRKLDKEILCISRDI